MACGHDETYLYWHGCPGSEVGLGPGIHALVIGIGNYPKGRAGQAFLDLVGAAAGAANFATFLAEEFHDPGDRPVRTIRLLLSPTEAERADHPVISGARWHPALYDDIGYALDDWSSDCNDHPDNVGILYVGGHGVVTTDGAQWVFLSEANNHKDPFRQSVNVLSIREAMRWFQLKASIIVSDACAVQHPAILSGRANGVGITPNPKGKRKRVRAYDLNISGARTGTESYVIGNQDGTLLSWALLPLMREAGEILNGSFIITKARLDQQLLPRLSSHPRAPRFDGQEPLIHGDYLIEGISRPEPPPIFPVKFVFVRAEGSDTKPIQLIVRNQGESPVVDEPGLNHLQHLPAGEYRVEAVTQKRDSSYHHSYYDLVVDKPRQVLAVTGKDYPGQ
jgi:hypothetical protein